MLRIDYDKALINDGELKKLSGVFCKASGNEKTSLAFIGGSITQGFSATSHENSYSYLIYKWWCETFKGNSHEYINAGIGATTSQYAVARVEEDVLSKYPDIVFIEFSVNDANDEFYKETYEGLIRRINSHDSRPAIVLLHNIKYDDGFSSQKIHEELGRHYNLTSISIANVLYEMVKNGKLKALEITSDYLHPNDLGHELISKIVINCLLRLQNDIRNKKISLVAGDANCKGDSIVSALTKNRFEKSNILRNNNCKPSLNGFRCDEAPKEYYTDIFKMGWTGKNVGDSFNCEVVASCIAIQYRKTINRPAPVAEVTVDENIKVILDGNFKEDWGDELHIDTVLLSDTVLKHKIAIEIIEGGADIKSEFYLNSIIYA